MSTYACWRLWVGFLLDDIDHREISQDACDLLDKICEEPLIVEGLKIEHISLLESSGGVGVIISELHWSDDARTFDTEEINNAKIVCGQLQGIFRIRGIVAKVRLMHHIDMGG